MAAEGASIVIADIQAELGERTAETLCADFGVEAIAVATDVREREQVLRAVDLRVDRFGAIDVLVNNAWGGARPMRLEYKTDEITAHGLQMALWPAFWAMRAVFPHMRVAAGAGSSTNRVLPTISGWDGDV